MKRSGFMLIEIIISTIIAGMMSVVLFAALYQIMQIQKFTVDTSNIEIHVLTFIRQITRDIEAIYLPIPPEQPADKNTKSDKKEPSPAVKNNSVTKNAQLENPYIALKGKGTPQKFDFLSFVTTNVMQSWTPQTTFPGQPSLARVTYRLEPDKRAGTFRLTRQESTDLRAEHISGDPLKAARAYTILSGIEQFSITYYWYDQNKKDEPATIHSGPIWDIQTVQKDQKDAEQSSVRDVPDFITISAIVWDETHSRSKSIAYTTDIMGQKMRTVTAKKTVAPPTNQQSNPFNTQSPAAPRR